jgi:hypothetical protein
MPKMLWVEFRATEKTYGPTRVSTDKCTYVDEFVKQIKKEFEIPYPATQLTLNTFKGYEIKPTMTMDSLGTAGQLGEILVVKHEAVNITQHTRSLVTDPQAKRLRTNSRVPSSEIGGLRVNVQEAARGIPNLRRI